MMRMKATSGYPVQAERPDKRGAFMKVIAVVIVAFMIFWVGYVVGSADARAYVKGNLIADCAVTGSFRIDKDAYKCVKITRATDEPKH